MPPEEMPQPERKDQRDELCDKLERLLVKQQQTEQRVQRLKERLKDFEELDRKN